MQKQISAKVNQEATVSIGRIVTIPDSRERHETEVQSSQVYFEVRGVVQFVPVDPREGTVGIYHPNGTPDARREVQHDQRDDAEKNGLD